MIGKCRVWMLLLPMLSIFSPVAVVCTIVRSIQSCICFDTPAMIELITESRSVSVPEMSASSFTSANVVSIVETPELRSTSYSPERFIAEPLSAVTR